MFLTDIQHVANSWGNCQNPLSSKKVGSELFSGGLQLQAVVKNIKASKHVFDFIRLPECKINFMSGGEGNGERRGIKLGEVIRDVSFATLKFRLICTKVESLSARIPPTSNIFLN